VTVWKAGMMAAVVANNWEYARTGKAPEGVPEIGDVFTVHDVKTSSRNQRTFWGRMFGKRVTRLRISGWGWVEAIAFRPVVGDDTALIERIKACKPARPPLPAPHPTGADPARWPLPAGGETSQCVGPFRRPFHDAAGCATSSHGAPGNLNQSLQQGRKNLSKLSSHGGLCG
jgi:hypothetical protein